MHTSCNFYKNEEESIKKNMPINAFSARNI